MKRIFFAALIYVIIGISIITHMIGLFTTSSFVASFISFTSFIGISIMFFYTLNQREDLEEKLLKLRQRATHDYRELSWQLKLSKTMRSSAESNLKTLSTTFDQLQDEHSTVLKELDASRKKLAKLKELHPRLDERIDSLIAEEQKEIDIETAKTYDALVNSSIDKPVSSENERLFKELIDKFNKLTDSQKEHVHSDISKVQEKYDACKKHRWQQEQQKRRRREEEARRRRQRQMDDDAHRRRMQMNTVLQILRS